MRKLNDEKINLIRKMLVENETISNIASTIGCSEKTVTRYKKTIPHNVFSEDTVKYDNFAQLTEREKIYTKKLESDLSLYEDEEEGWVYHLDKKNFQLKTSGLWWGAIAYPESAPEGWIDRLAMTHAAIAISPLHDCDIWLHDNPEMVDITTGEIIPKGARYKAGDRKKRIIT